MSNIVIDLGRGLLIVGALFVFIWVILLLALVVSIKEAWAEREADLDRMDRLVKQDRARAAEANVHPSNSRMDARPARK